MTYKKGIQTTYKLLLYFAYPTTVGPEHHIILWVMGWWASRCRGVLLLGWCKSVAMVRFEHQIWTGRTLLHEEASMCAAPCCKCSTSQLLQAVSSLQPSVGASASEPATPRNWINCLRRLALCWGTAVEALLLVVGIKTSKVTLKQRKHYQEYSQ